ncbi:PREDICTED: uncharacterized protein LOC108553505 [Eufriesea mexicana]|uniref:uncharacterized protein LOC108553505 n=1 Tax=Eufriesea mexicana TaxID=516756 RepID=UPI00083C4E95|nr:PREDICTED: uncharacterized protein LOC108553505 [Eufriesea mexicana]
MPIHGNDTLDLEKLREMAKIASIYHRDRRKFVRNRNLSHVVHAGLHVFQSIIGLSIIIFHHVHHYLNRKRQEEDQSVPDLPQETNVIFFIYPLCMLVSMIFAVLWLSTDIFMNDPRIVLIGCFIVAALMLTFGIIEMKHVDMYLDLSKISDDELLKHPIFIHNFILCLLSVFCMCIYLIQGWILIDYYLWIRKQEEIRDTTDDLQVSDSEEEEDSDSEEDRKYKSKEKETLGELDPIPVLEMFPSVTMSETLSIDEEDVIFYCCFVDWYNYLKRRKQMQQPLHEFQSNCRTFLINKWERGLEIDSEVDLEID